MDKYILRLENITKSFPGVKALDSIKLCIKRGEIHALIGENGAGKSTLIKILAGIYHPDTGTIYIDEVPITMDSVLTSQKSGISVIHQELSLAENMTIMENIYLGRIPRRKNGLVDDRKMYEDTKRLLHTVGLDDLQPDEKVEKLSVAKQQMIEICRSLSTNCKILIMDEPTASLAAAEVETLIKLMKQLKEKGVTILFISHKLNEIYEVCERITVLRDGKYIGTETVEELSYDRLINMMVGREITNIFPPHINKPGEVFFAVNDICSDKVRNVSFDLRKGEILGFYGLMGSGRSEIMRALLGIDKSKKGDILLNNEKIRINSPVEATHSGIVLAPEDRKHEGLILAQTVTFNTVIAILGKLIKGIRLNYKRQEKIITDISRKLRLKTASYDTKVMNLSGGNQQKVVLAKWLVTNPQILILDEPTRGIDVGAKQEIYKLIYEIVGMGVGVILISSEMPEVINLCDRVYVVREGKITGLLGRKDLSEQTILKYAIGGIGHE